LRKLGFRLLAIPILFLANAQIRPTVKGPRVQHQFSTIHPSGKRPYTIKDGIAISYFVDGSESTKIEDRGGYPPGGPIMSPDGKHFLLITQRGAVATNKLEATLYVFDRRTVLRYLSTRVGGPPFRKIVTMRATSNTPVINDVRWLEDSKRIAFLGKNNSSYQGLFVTDIQRGTLERVTKLGVYVTAYDVRGKTIAYTTLAQNSNVSKGDLISARGKTIYSLLASGRPLDIRDINEYWMNIFPSVLHVQRKGAHLATSFTFEGRPLGLFKPVLALSPDGEALITVAPVHEIPSGWEQYQPGPGAEVLRLKSDGQYASADDNPWKASQYVKIDLHSGVVSPLVNAPAGRSLMFGAPSSAYWFSDSRRAVLSSTYLPPDTAGPESQQTRQQRTAAVAEVDVSTNNIQPIMYVNQNGSIDDVNFDSRRDEVRIAYVLNAGGGSKMATLYRFVSGKWVMSTANQTSDQEVQTELHLSIREDLNEAPVLVGRLHLAGEPSIICDPNPQLKQINMGRVINYRWQDRRGSERSGLLVLPDDYDSSKRYPLVIQTYGYELNRFFVDGPFTTSFAARALAAEGIVVLQMDYITKDEGTPEEASDQLDGFESVIAELTKDGLIDRHRVGLIGFSRTCFHVLFAIEHAPDLFAAASITDGLNFGYFQYLLSADQVGSQELFERVNRGMPFAEGLRTWLSTSPGFNLDKVRAPLLISALERDELMSEWEVYAGLRRLNKPVDMLWWRTENAPHLLVEPAQRYMSQQSTVDWFSFWLNGETNPDPEKAEQYVRWRELGELRQKEQ
jgi:dipeptidyl aminopeptidase/acylaminoacyl peptidase